MSFLKRHLPVVTACVLLLLTAVMLWLLKNPTSLDDGLRHFAMAAHYRDHGILQTNGWQTFFYEGWLSHNPVDPWFLSDVLLIPFTFLPLTAGLDLFILFSLLCLLTSFLLVLRSYRIPSIASSIFLLLLLFGELQFTGRFLFGRPYALLTAMTLFALWAIKERRFLLVCIFLLISVLLSQLFVFPLVVCGCAVIAFAFTHRYREASQLSFATVIGVTAGCALHPQPFLYLSYLMTVFLRIPFLKSIGLSREMFSGLSYTSGLSVFVIIAVIILFWAHLRFQKQRKDLFNNPDLLLVCLPAAFFTLAFLFWLRAIDLLWPLLLLSLAAIFAEHPSLPHGLLSIMLPQKTKRNALLFFAIVLVCGAHIISVPFVFFRNDAQKALVSYEILQQIPSHSRVLNLDWDHFFHYVAVRPDLRYAQGIDKTFTYLTDPSVLTDTKEIADTQKVDGSQALLALQRILETYPSDYIVLTHQHFDPLIRLLQKEGKMPLMGNTEAIAVFSVPK